MSGLAFDESAMGPVCAVKNLGTTGKNYVRAMKKQDVEPFVWLWNNEVLTPEMLRWDMPFSECLEIIKRAAVKRDEHIKELAIMLVYCLKYNDGLSMHADDYIKETKDIVLLANTILIGGCLSLYGIGGETWLWKYTVTVADFHNFNLIGYQRYMIPYWYPDIKNTLTE